jgi:serine-aspartate repeat-containing protein C/D/E
MANLQKNKQNYQLKSKKTIPSLQIFIFLLFLSVSLTAQSYGSIKGFVFNDKNANGIQESGELGIKGITLSLNNGDNAISDANGRYTFSNLLSGTYVMLAQLPNGYWFSPSHVGTKEKDSDFTDVGENVVYVAKGQNWTNIDLGMYKLIGLGSTQLNGTVFHDKNANGIQETGETGISGVKVSLEFNQIPLGTVTSDAAGKYKFFGLDERTYSVSFVNPSKYVFSPSITNTDLNKNSDADASGLSVVTVLKNQKIAQVDAGLFKKASITGFVWNDLDKDGIQGSTEIGLGGTKIELTGEANNGSKVELEAVSNSLGKYSFSDLYPGVYQINVMIPSNLFFTEQKQGKTATKDSDIEAGGLSPNVTLTSGMIQALDAGLIKIEYLALIGGEAFVDLNGNGIREAKESAMTNVTVNLVSNSKKIRTGKTNGLGQYKFNNLPKGDYEIFFDKPSNFEFTPAKKGFDINKDSDVGVDGDVKVSLAKNDEKINNIGAGFYQPAKLTGFLWNDTNKDGIQDATEKGFADVPVELSGSKGDGSDELIIATTDKNGYYSFPKLAPGEYHIQLWSFPDKFVATLLDQGTDDNKDSDIDDSGLTPDFIFASGKSLKLDGGFVSTVIAINRPSAGLHINRYGRYVDLQWITLFEKDDESYIIERSVGDEKNFMPIKTITPLGKTADAKIYRDVDTAPIEGENFYRVKQTFIDGSFVYTNIKSLKFDARKQEMVVYPNPAKDIINVNMQAYAKRASTIQILDSNGRVVETIEKAADADALQFNVQHLPSGFYKITSLSKNQEVITTNFVIQKD